MVGTNSIRGSRVGSGPVGETERGETAPRVCVSYWCVNGHESRPTFAQDADVQVPETWDCPKCGLPAGQDPQMPPEAPRNEPYKTHLAYVKERRDADEGEHLLQEALTALRARRGEGPDGAGA